MKYDPKAETEWLTKEMPVGEYETGLIAQSLHEAYEAGRAAATPPPGHVLTDDGVVRRVLPPTSGPYWHKTSDDCVVPNTSAIVWSYELQPGGKTFGSVIKMKYQTWLDTRYDETMPSLWYEKAPDGKWGCYSTREAAEAARQRGEA